MELDRTPILTIKGDEFEDFLVVSEAPWSLAAVGEPPVPIVAHFGIAIGEETRNLIPVNFAFFGELEQFLVFVFTPPSFFGLVAEF